MGTDRKHRPTVAQLIHGLSTQLMTIQINLGYLHRYIPPQDSEGLSAYEDLLTATERSVADFNRLRTVTTRIYEETSSAVKKLVDEHAAIELALGR